MAREKVAVRHDPPTYHMLTDAELENLQHSARNPSKENFLFCLGVLLPTVVNVYADVTRVPFEVTVPIFLNGVVAVSSFLIGGQQGFCWWATRDKFEDELTRLRQRPITYFLAAGPSENVVFSPPPKAGGLGAATFPATQ